jgi:hypothetical protein
MTSAMPPGAAIPEPDDLPPEEQPRHQQPDPFGEPTDEQGAPLDAKSDDVGDLDSEGDQRGD